MPPFAMLPSHHPLRRYFEDKCASGQHYETRESCQAHIDALTCAREKALAGITVEGVFSEDEHGEAISHAEVLSEWCAQLERSELVCDKPLEISLLSGLMDCEGGIARWELLKAIAKALHPHLTIHQRLLPAELYEDWQQYRQWLIARRLLNDLEEADLHWRGKRASLRIDVRLRQAEVEAWQEYQQMVNAMEEAVESYG